MKSLGIKRRMLIKTIVLDRAECNHKTKWLQNEYHYLILINAVTRIIVQMPFLKVFLHTKVAHVLENNIEVLKLKSVRSD
jgi:hypothetical protein